MSEQQPETRPDGPAAEGGARPASTAGATNPSLAPWRLRSGTFPALPKLPAPIAKRLDPVWRRLHEFPAAARSIRTLVIIASGLKSESITLRAGALTYLFTLAVVPLLAVVFSLVQAVVGTDEIRTALQEYLTRNLAVGAGESVTKWLNRYVQRATGAAVGGVGFAFLLVSAVSLVANIEAAFNATFHAPRQRPLWLRLVIYWCVLTLGPILLALTVAPTVLLPTASFLKGVGWLRQLLLAVLPVLVTWLLFSLLYFAVPAVTVRRRAAVLGGVVAGTGWEVAKVVYAYVSARSVQRDAIYGALSAIPAFMLWIYISWVLVLFGARVAYAAQASHASLRDEDLGRPLPREVFAARVLAELGRAFRDGLPPPESAAVAEWLHASDDRVRLVLLELDKAGLVRQVQPSGWVPARSLDQVTLGDVRAAVRGGLPVDVRREAGWAPIVRAWEAADAQAQRILTIPISSILPPPPVELAGYAAIAHPTQAP